MPRFIFALLVILLAAPAARAADPTAAFADACQKFEKQEFTQARDAFLGIIDGGNLSADVCYNLGTVEYALKNPGRAALWYQRALVMEPTHREAAQNLRFLKKSEAVTWLPFFSWINPTIATALRDLGLWILLGSVLTLFWLRRKKAPLWPAVTTLALSLVAIGLAIAGLHLRSGLINPEKIQVVISNESNAYTAPAEASEAVISLVPGAQVLPLEQRGAWTYIELANANRTRGWVRQESLEPLWPFPGHLAKF